MVGAALAPELDALDQRAVDREERGDHRNLIHALLWVVVNRLDRRRSVADDH
jgi:hypothetical protein